MIDVFAMSLPPATPQLLHYRTLASPRLGPWQGVKAIARSSLLLLARRKLFWVLYAFSLLIFLFYFFGQYLMVFLENRVSESLVRTGGGLTNRTFNPEFVTKMLRDALHMDGSADTFGDFMWTEGYIAMVILAFAGSIIIGNDFLHNSLPFYLSKPISRRHYLFGKALAVAVVVNAHDHLARGVSVHRIRVHRYVGLLRRFVPATARHPRLRGGLTVTLTLLLLVTATWLRRTVPLVMVWTAVFILARLVPRWLVDQLQLSPRWRLIDIWNDMYLFGQWCFGTEHHLLRPLSQEQPAYWEATAVMVAVCVACALYLRKRVRAVEVVT